MSRRPNGDGERGPACAVCAHPRRGRIYRDLASGKYTPHGLAAAYSVTPADVRRHIDVCGGEALALMDDPAYGPLDDPASVVRGALEMYETARAIATTEDDPSVKAGTRVRAVSEAGALLELRAKLLGMISASGVSVEVGGSSLGALVGDQDWAAVVAQVQGALPVDEAECARVLHVLEALEEGAADGGA